LVFSLIRTEISDYVSELLNLFFFKDFIYLFDGEKEITSRQRGRLREKGKQALCLAKSLDAELDPRTLRS